MANEIKKIILAYSGGLDTSIIIPWLHETYPGCEVICVAGNVGQDSEIEGLEAGAVYSGCCFCSKRKRGGLWTTHPLQC